MISEDLFVNSVRSNVGRLIVVVVVGLRLLGVSVGFGGVIEHGGGIVTCLKFRAPHLQSVKKVEVLVRGGLRSGLRLGRN